MEKVVNKISMLLQISKYVIALFVITLFSVLLTSKVNAAAFNYSEFDFDSYFAEKGDIWAESCNGDENCIDEVVKTQKKFYKKLYKLLAKYSKKGIIADNSFVDNIILETVFFNLGVGEYSDEGFDYKEEWGSGNNAYEIDPNEEDDFDIEPDMDYENLTEEESKYFNDEKDTLKLLVSNLFSYTTKCYGIYGDPKIKTDSNGNKIKECSQGTLDNIPSKNIFKTYEEKCVDTKTYGLGFWKYYVSKLQHDNYIAKFYTSISILGVVPVDENYDNCKELYSAYPEGTVYAFMKDGELPKLDTDNYFDFLSYNRYFDRKAHLQEYFEDDILKPANVDCMTKNLCDNSLEASGLYDQYEEKIIEARRDIIEEIISILNGYGISLSYAGYGIEFGTSAINSDNTGWWWPIGSDTYYPNEPIPTAVTSYFGTRTSPTAGASTNHKGIDIAPTISEYKTNGTRDVPIIATRDGVVYSITLNSKTAGNKIMLQHDNGMYSAYLHLDRVIVSNGQSVKQGEVIGYMGNTGVSTGRHLHFEILTDENTRVNPLDYVSPLNARPVTSSGKYVDGGENQKSICLTLKASGFSDNGIAAILGNISAESGFSPSADNGTHGGIVQWDYDNRYKKLKEYRPYDYTTLEGQVLFMIHEMQSSYPKVYDKVRNSGESAKEIGEYVCMNYEVSGKSECNKRYNYPDNYLSYVQNNCS